MASRLWHYYQYLTATDIVGVRGNNTDTAIHMSSASAFPTHTPEERRAIDAEIKALVDKVLHRKP